MRPAVVLVVGNDSRGGDVRRGQALAEPQMGSGTVRLAADFTIDLAPDREIRGHQIGYRPTANSYDAWTLEQFEQYFRDLVIFGANAIENIPFRGKTSDLMKYGRRDESQAEPRCATSTTSTIGSGCRSIFCSPNPKKSAPFFAEQEDFYKTVPRLDAVFIPGGDPGDNPMKALLPYVEKMAPCCKSTIRTPRFGSRCSGLSRGTPTSSSSMSPRRSRAGSGGP